MLWEAGLSQAEALELSASSAANRAVVYGLWRLVPGARQGIPLSQLLASSGVVPVEVAHIVATGEQTGSLGDSLRRLAETYGMESEAGEKKMIVMAYVGLYMLAAALILYAVLTFWMGYGAELSRFNQ
jgi:type II secretory pathway component PulF